MALVENNCASQINFAVGILITSQIIQRYFIVANDFERCEKYHLNDFRHFKTNALISRFCTTAK